MFVRFISVLGGAAGALAASQAPGYTQQYMQNLEGRVDELRVIVERFDANIDRIGYDRDRAVEECGTAGEDLLGALCDGIAQDLARYERLSAQAAALEAAPDWQRPLLLAKDADPDIARSTYEVFEPAVPATPTGAGYAAGGFAGIWAVFASLFGGLGRLVRRDA